MDRVSRAMTALNDQIFSAASLDDDDVASAGISEEFARVAADAYAYYLGADEVFGARGEHAARAWVQDVKAARVASPYFDFAVVSSTDYGRLVIYLVDKALGEATNPPPHPDVVPVLDAPGRAGWFPALSSRWPRRRGSRPGRRR